MAQLEIERARVDLCVQCGQEYKELTNGDGHCCFHAGFRTDWGRSWTCCNKRGRSEAEAKAIDGCQRNRHRAQHHTDYPYALYREWVQLQYKFVKTKWHDVRVSELHGDEPDREVEFGLRTDKKVFLAIGTGYRTEEMHVYDVDQLLAIQERGPGGNKDPIVSWREAELDRWFVSVSWFFDGDTLAGIESSIKVISADEPLVSRTRFKLKPLARVGDTEHVSGQPPVRRGATIKQYALKSSKAGKWFDDALFNAPKPEPDFATEKSKPDSAFRVKRVAPTACNKDWRQGKHDIFTLTLMLINASHQDDANIIDVRVEAQYEGQWIPHDQIKFSDGGVRDVPIDVPKRKSIKTCIHGYIPIPGTTDHESANHGTSYMARKGPVPLRVIFETIDGDTFTQHTAFQNRALSVPTMTKQDFFFAYADDLQDWTRVYARVHREKELSFTIRAPNTSIQVKQEQLEEWAYKCKKDKLRELPLSNLNDNAKGVKATALYDKDINEVYAIRFEVTSNTASMTDHFMYPLNYVQAHTPPPPLAASSSTKGSRSHRRTGSRRRSPRA